MIQETDDLITEKIIYYTRTINTSTLENYPIYGKFLYYRHTCRPRSPSPR